MLQIIKIFFIGIILSNHISYASDIEMNHYEFRVLFIYKMMHMVDWNEHMDDSKELTVCFFTEDNNYMSESKKYKAVKKHELIFMHVNKIKVTECNVLFIDESKKSDYLTMLKRISNLPILTMSGINNFAKYGGMVHMFLGKLDKVKLKINLKSVRKSHLLINARLLALAEIIK
jgi:hypothetical protein